MNLSNVINFQQETIESSWIHIVQSVREEYLAENQRYPWIIGFSGGKDSTVVAHAVDETGAENLLGAGDMLVKAKPGGQTERVHGVRATRTDIESVLRERS